MLLFIFVILVFFFSFLSHWDLDWIIVLPASILLHYFHILPSLVFTQHPYPRLPSCALHINLLHCTLLDQYSPFGVLPHIWPALHYLISPRYPASNFLNVHMLIHGHQ